MKIIIRTLPNKWTNSQVVIVTLVLVILPPVVVTAVKIMEYSTPGNRSLSVILVVVLLIDTVDPGIVNL